MGETRAAADRVRRRPGHQHRQPAQRSPAALAKAYRPRHAGLRSFESNGVIVDEVGAPERRYKLVAHHGFEDARWHVTRVIARPEARTAEPVLKPDRAWEARAAGLSGTVLRDGPNGTYRLWYRSFHDGRPESDRNFLNYAESADGLAGRNPRCG